MSSQVAANRYAEAFWNFNPVEAGIAVEELQSLLADLARETLRWGRLNDPTRPIKTRLQEVVERWPDLSNTSQAFLHLILKEGRASLLPLIVSSLYRRVLRGRNQIEVNVTAAVKLTDAERADLAVTLGRRLGKGVVLQQHLDATVLGGLVLQADDWILDLSLAGQLARLRHRLTGRDGVIVDEPTSTGD